MLKTPPWATHLHFQNPNVNWKNYAMLFHINDATLGRDVLMFYEPFKVGNDFSYTCAMESELICGKGIRCKMMVCIITM